LILLPLAAVPFSNTKSDVVPAYLLTFLSLFALFLLFKFPKAKKYTIVGLYASFSILLLVSIYLSVIHSPHMRATFMLVGLVLTPLTLHRSSPPDETVFNLLVSGSYRDGVLSQTTICA
jgi:hypothetical protein